MSILTVIVNLLMVKMWLWITPIQCHGSIPVPQFLIPSHDNQYSHSHIPGRINDPNVRLASSTCPMSMNWLKSVNLDSWSRTICPWLNLYFTIYNVLSLFYWLISAILKCNCISEVCFKLLSFSTTFYLKTLVWNFCY